MTRFINFILAIAVGIGVAATAAPQSWASSIKVKVDDQPITSYDIEQRARLLRISGAGGGTKAATEELIDETLKFIEAAKRSFSVSERRVDQAIAAISQGMGITPKQLEQGLAQEGVNIATLRRRIKSQMVWQQLVQARMSFETSVSSSDVTAALFAERGGEPLKTTEFTLQQIVFVVPGGSSSAYKAQRRREAEAFRQRFPGCERSLEQAKLLNGVVVKPLGRRTSADLANGGPGGKEIMDTPVGKTTRPAESSQGYDLIAVCATRELNTDAPARKQVENKLLLEQNKDFGKDYLAELREKAIIEYR